jgi:hypothetical protein
MFFLWLIVTGRVDRRAKVEAVIDNSDEALEAK